MVLILIVVDDGLVHLSTMRPSSQVCVLILIVVDDGLVQFKDARDDAFEES